jgi:hypothetical protein
VKRFPGATSQKAMVRQAARLNRMDPMRGVCGESGFLSVLGMTRRPAKLPFVTIPKADVGVEVRALGFPGGPWPWHGRWADRRGGLHGLRLQASKWATRRHPLSGLRGRCLSPGAPDKDYLALSPAIKAKGHFMPQSLAACGARDAGCGPEPRRGSLPLKTRPWGLMRKVRQKPRVAAACGARPGDRMARPRRLGAAGRGEPDKLSSTPIGERVPVGVLEGTCDDGNKVD